MKKGVCALMAFACFPAWSLDWNLPVFTMRYEVAGGGVEDPDDDTIEPSSIRHTVSLRVKEEADPAAFGLGFIMAAKDYYQQAGDYSYFKVEHDASVHVGDPWKLGYTIGLKRMQYPETDSEGFSKDALSMNAAATAAVRLWKGASLEAGLGGRFSVTENPANALQAYTAAAGFSTRLGDWLLAMRYHGQFRLPLGAEADANLDTYHTASVSLQWDPN
jgi:hypothetical protein